MTIRFPNFAGLACLVATAALMAGCSSHGSKADRPDNPFRADSAKPGDPKAPLSERELRLEADQSYRRAHDSLASSDYSTAITRYTQLISRYPFSEYATQAELEKIFAQYRSFQADEAGLAADRFLREHPRHPNADYVQYIKGLTDSNRDNGLIDYLPLDSSKRDASNSRRAYDDFALLLQRFPSSRYASDARKRMIYLRNRIASHELSVTRYYIKRGAWVAAAKRGESIIAEYPGAPATAEALLLLQECYGKLGETAQLAEVMQLIAVNSASVHAARNPVVETETRSVVAASAVAAPSAAEAAAATTTPPPQGFFGRAASLLNGLNKTYTLPSAQADASSATATPPAGVNASRGESDFAAPASLTTGPYSGPDSSITLPQATDNRTPVEAEGNPQPVPATAAGATTTGTQPAKEKGGFFDFLNKTYTVGGSSKSAAPAAAPEALAPAAAPSSRAPIAAETSAAPPAPISGTAATATAAPPAAAAATPPKEKGGVFDFLNRTYTIGGSDKKKPADAAAPAANSEPGETAGSPVHVSLDYEDETRKKADEDAVKTATVPVETSPPPAAEPAR